MTVVDSTESSTGTANNGSSSSARGAPSGGWHHQLLLRIADLYHHQAAGSAVIAANIPSQDCDCDCDDGHDRRHHHDSLGDCKTDSRVKAHLRTSPPPERPTRRGRLPPSSLPHPFTISAVAEARSQTLTATISSSSSSSSNSPSSMTPEERRKLSDKAWREYCQWTRQQKIKRGVWAAAFAAVIVVGTITGAQLKTDKQKEKAIKEFRAITAADQIALLETQRAHLIEQKAALQKKLDVFHDRLRERQLEKSNAKR
ncbi:hypothetical protein PT974_01370 [Cladobotryum mycophilum]|uniref:Uncharacterized protein n=1 Tax=Cladobotryum mycophilum TaxID=491253 RepID=A0ABR0T4L0_9HYPO